MRFSTIAVAAAAGTAVAQQSICDKYTIALLKQNTGANQLTLLTLLVNTALIGNFTGPGTSNSDLPGSMVDVPGILTPGKYMGTPVALAKYFDGSLKSTNSNGKAVSVNFLDGGGATPILKDPTSPGKAGSNQATLLMHLYSYFGLLLGCSNVGKSGFPAYMGDPSMGSVHQYMGLDNAEFTYFVTQVGLAAASFGVSAADVKAAGTALIDGFGMRCAPAAAIGPLPKEPLAICQASDCPQASMSDCSLYDTMEPQPVGGPMPTGGSPTTMPVPSTTPTNFPGAAAALPTAAAGMAVAAAGALAAAFL